MNVYIRFELPREDKVSGIYGPYPFVQLTYELLRVGPDGYDIAQYYQGYWEIIGEDEIYSDVIIFSKEIEIDKDKFGADVLLESR